MQRVDKNLPLGSEVALCALSSGDSEAGGRPPINKSEKSTKLSCRFQDFKQGEVEWIAWHIGHKASFCNLASTVWGERIKKC
jgi:hypothetical protein